MDFCPMNPLRQAGKIFVSVLGNSGNWLRGETIVPGSRARPSTFLASRKARGGVNIPPLGLCRWWEWQLEVGECSLHNGSDSWIQRSLQVNRGRKEVDGWLPMVRYIEFIWKVFARIWEVRSCVPFMRMHWYLGLFCCWQTRRGWLGGRQLLGVSWELVQPDSHHSWNGLSFHEMAL